MNCASCGQENRASARFCDGCGADLATCEEESPVSSDDLVPSIGFVGRRRELNELRAALQDALAGRGRLVMLAGEPGIGKTRTTQELAAYATLKGAHVMWARCHSAGGMPSYWPWVQAIRSYAQGQDTERLRSMMGVGVADIAAVVPELKERLPDVEPLPALEAEEARFRLFDSVTAFVKQVSQSQPLVIVLENLHWADRPSLQLLEFLTQEIVESAVLILGTYRDTELMRRHPLAQTLGELSREPFFRRVLLRGLDQEEVGRFIEANSSFTPPDDLIGLVHTQTQGNPLFMTQIVQLMVQEGALTERVGEQQQWSIQIPIGIHEAIGRRLDRLSERCNQVLTVASVIGREFELRLLERLAEEQSGEDLLEPVEEALAARVIEELPQAPECYQFTHVLIQNTLASEVSAVRRARLHRRIAEALEEMYGPNTEEHAAELAYHYFESSTANGPDKLIHYSLLAGERALATYGHEEALEHFLRALHAKEGAPVDSETAALLFGLGRAQAATLQREQIQEALASLTRALDYYLEAGDVEGAVAVVVYPLPPVTGPTENAHNIRRVLALVSPDSRQAAQLLSRYGWILGVEEGDFSGAQEAFNRALTIAQGGADAVLEEQTLAYAARVDAYNHSWEQSLGKSLQALELADRNDHTRNQLDACYRAAFSLHVMGDLQESALYAARAMDLAERLRDRYWLANALWINELVARLKGDWHGARTFSDRGLAIWPRDPRLLGTRVLLEYEVASFDQGQAYLERLMEIMRLTVPGPVLEYTTAAQVVPMIARITGTSSHLEVTERAAEAVLSSPSVTRGMANDIKGGLGLLAVHRGDIAGAEKEYAALESERGHLLFAAISGDRLLGLLCHTMSNLEQAVAHFEDALAFCRKGYRPELAWTCCDYADTLLRRNNPGDRRKAMSLLDESLVISEELGMHPLMERVVALQEQTQSRPSRATKYPGGLTQREVEVLSAAAAGKTNAEIADELFISLHTVARHLTNIFAKTGTSSRAEAAVYAAQHDLL